MESIRDKVSSIRLRIEELDTCYWECKDEGMSYEEEAGFVGEFRSIAFDYQEILEEILQK